VLGIGSALTGLSNGAPIPNGDYMPEDYFRYSAAGTRLVTSDPSAQVYFSYDGGLTLLQQFNQSASGDFNDWVGNCDNELIQNAYACPDRAAPLDYAPEFTVLQTLGYDYLMFERLVTYLFRH
jgi:hypothetical protein